MGGPNVVRGGSHSGNVAAADLARHGLLDILSSDYVPSSLLGAVVRLVDDEILSLPQAVTAVSYKPAQATGLMDRGRITQGLRADLVQVRFIAIPEGKRHAVVRAVWREGVRVL
jgi:alpha-D-ribose 1-methylphosphonate 5-triphosphate diphosphatase